MPIVYNIAPLIQWAKDNQAQGTTIYEGNALEDDTFYATILVILEEEKLDTKYQGLASYCSKTIQNFIDEAEAEWDELEDEDED